MKNLDRAGHEIWAACAAELRDDKPPLIRILKDVPGLKIYTVDMGTDRIRESLRASLRSKFNTLVGLARAFRSVVGLMALIRRERIDVIHTDEWPRDALVCVLLGRLTSRKSVIHLHVAYGEWMSPLLKWSLKRADMVVTVSNFVARSLLERGFEPTRIGVVLNGINVADWNPGAGRDEARRGLQIAATAPVVITVCRLSKGKGVWQLVRAMPSLVRERPDVQLLIVGAAGEVQVEEELRSLIEELGVQHNVRLTGWRQDVPRLMAAADVFAMPSDAEPFGLVFAEAMAMKLPVVALDNGGTREIVENGRTGLLSELGDLDGLTANLLTLLRAPALREAMGAAGRQRVESFFTASRMARDVAAVYGSLLGAHSPEPVDVVG
jgi:glycosyltransferase involved in cell wall biosynthesis